MNLRFAAASLRARLFVTLSAAIFAGALATGLTAVAFDVTTLGFTARLVHVAPKAIALACALLPVAAILAALVGGKLARPIEDLTAAATRIAEGNRSTRLPRGGGGDEMRRLARALVSMRRELEGKPYAAAFLRDALHDLKTPVAAIAATLELLDEGALEEPEAARRFVRNLRRSTEDLESRLGDLVTLARFETASISDERTRMSDLVTEATSRVRPLAEATNVKLTAAPHDGDWLRCDPRAIERALSNLLENAVNATPQGHVTVHVEPRADAIVIDVINEPATVPGHVRARLFERAHASGKGRGSGLGLAMVRAAIEAHGGTIRFVEMGPPRVTIRCELPR